MVLLLSLQISTIQLEGSTVSREDPLYPELVPETPLSPPPSLPCLSLSGTPNHRVSDLSLLP